ncbi:MAG: SAM-dependent methyltransferase [Leptolyngbyaceae bacterium]|nr:SAM-dependent methyltransferase [Leptolyngbyaceae bacterium]
MGVRLQEVVPFGRSLDEYVKIFNLTETDLHRTILGIADGPASFNAEATQQGSTIISVDPLYQFSGSEIRQRFDAVLDDIIYQVASTPDDFVWTYHASPEALRNSRVQTIERFLADYDRGLQEQRYCFGELPHLNFPDNHFDLALCSHLLFLYSEQLGETFHRQAIYELARVSREVRIFPLITLMLGRSPFLDPLISELEQVGYHVQIERSHYEFQKGGNEMLVIKTNTSP